MASQRKPYLMVGLFVAVFLCILMTSNPSLAQGGANLGGNMMMEHINMACENCHGKGGPKGMMMEHVGIPCMTCHGGLAEAKSIKKPERARTALKNAMMMEHIGMKCSNCHGEDGPKGMMLEHEGIDCLTCHPMNSP